MGPPAPLKFPSQPNFILRYVQDIIFIKKKIQIIFLKNSKKVLFQPPKVPKKVVFFPTHRMNSRVLPFERARFTDPETVKILLGPNKKNRIFFFYVFVEI